MERNSSKQRVHREEVLFLSLAEIAFIFSFTFVIIILFPPQNEADKLELDCNFLEHLVYIKELEKLDPDLLKELRLVFDGCGYNMHAGAIVSETDQDRRETLDSYCEKAPDLLMLNRSRYNEIFVSDPSIEEITEGICGYELIMGSLSAAIGRQACFSYLTDDETFPYMPYAVASLSHTEVSENIIRISFEELATRHRDWNLSDPIEMQERHDLLVTEVEATVVPTKIEADYAITRTNGLFGFTPISDLDEAADQSISSVLSTFTKFQTDNKCSAYVHAEGAFANYRNTAIHAFFFQRVDDHLNPTRTDESLK